MAKSKNNIYEVNVYSSDKASNIFFVKAKNEKQAKDIFLRTRGKGETFKNYKGEKKTLTYDLKTIKIKKTPEYNELLG